ncbi:MAG: anthranilate synthase component I family protein, partial [Thaumarchaeota archaeon]|nr:anthranilate synthase component I family protein [Nitrososphaerota archaeon]
VTFQALPDLESNLISIFAEIRPRHRHACILESSAGADRLAELSVVVFDPSYVLTAAEGHCKVEDLNNKLEVELDEADPLNILQKIVENFPTNNTQFRFAGGVVGYISFDAVRYWENKVFSRRQEPKLTAESYPDIQFGVYDQGIIIDHIRRKAFYFSSDFTKENHFEEVKQICQKNNNPRDYPMNDEIRYSNPHPNVTREYFESSVVRAKDYIRNGEIFQVVLSKRLDFSFTGEPLRFYSTLRKLNPSPYMYFLDLGGTKIIGSSPEMLVRAENGIVETFPIAGTGPRSLDKRENSRLANELLSDPKERAEHLMLVDLGRNDIGRVSEFGSVSVPEFMEVHQYSHVQHIVSHVTGRLRAGLTSFDAMRSIFPAGTLSGAPKIRSIQIIDELEPESRGPYGGAVGYFSFNGNMDSAITIRTLIAKENRASIQVGAGIVADSSPEAEWEETDRKAAALLRALEISAEKNGSAPGV